MKRLAVTSILIRGDCDEGEGDSLCRLASVQLLDNGAEEGAGAVLPRRLYVEVADSEPVERLVVTLRLVVSFTPCQLTIF